MDIYVVQSGDTINDIANQFGVSADRLIIDNGLENPLDLIPGQTIVIAYPTMTHIVREGDSLAGIASTYGVPIMQLLRNNPFLSGRQYLYPDETLVISYNTNGRVIINGYTYTYINRETLTKTLPYLTYLSVFNYNVLEEGKIISHGDDADIVQLAKDYGAVPLLMISSISLQGKPNLEIIFNLLLSKDLQTRYVSNLINILRTTGYYGLNVLINGINESNQQLYIELLKNISMVLRNEGYQIFVTINPNLHYADGIATFENIDYSLFSPLVDGITFLQYTWGTYYGPPGPVSSINLIRNLVDHVISMVPAEKIIIGKPLVAYDWELPYDPNNPDRSHANSLTLNSALALARDVGATIEFDEVSQTPFFRYQVTFVGLAIDHIVWFIDARSIDALVKLIKEYRLAGSGIWNIMIYYQQMWTVINSQSEIVKLLTDNL